MMTANMPTPTQAAVIRYFAGGPRPTLPTGDNADTACRRRGWIEECDSFPFHRATDAGRAALAAYVAAERAARADTVRRVAGQLDRLDAQGLAHVAALVARLTR